MAETLTPRRAPVRYMVRPHVVRCSHDDGWAVDAYDGRGAWIGTSYHSTKKQAQAHARKQRRELRRCLAMFSESYRVVSVEHGGEE